MASPPCIARVHPVSGLLLPRMKRHCSSLLSRVACASPRFLDSKVHTSYFHSTRVPPIRAFLTSRYVPESAPRIKRLPDPPAVPFQELRVGCWYEARFDDEENFPHMAQMRRSYPQMFASGSLRPHRVLCVGLLPEFRIARVAYVSRLGKCPGPREYAEAQGVNMEEARRWVAIGNVPHQYPNMLRLTSEPWVIHGYLKINRFISVQYGDIGDGQSKHFYVLPEARKLPTPEDGQVPVPEYSRIISPPWAMQYIRELSDAWETTMYSGLGYTPEGVNAWKTKLIRLEEKYQPFAEGKPWGDKQVKAENERLQAILTRPDAPRKKTFSDPELDEVVRRSEAAADLRHHRSVLDAAEAEARNELRRNERAQRTLKRRAVGEWEAAALVNSSFSGVRSAAGKKRYGGVGGGAKTSRPGGRERTKTKDMAAMIAREDTEAAADGEIRKTYSRNPERVGGFTGPRRGKRSFETGSIKHGKANPYGRPYGRTGRGGGRTDAGDNADPWNRHLGLDRV